VVSWYHKRGREVAPEAGMRQVSCTESFPRILIPHIRSNLLAILVHGVQLVDPTDPSPPSNLGIHQWLVHSRLVGRQVLAVSGNGAEKIQFVARLALENSPEREWKESDGWVGCKWRTLRSSQRASVS
jgi:hypothetical protein